MTDPSAARDVQLRLLIDPQTRAALIDLRWYLTRYFHYMAAPTPDRVRAWQTALTDVLGPHDGPPPDLDRNQPLGP